MNIEEKLWDYLDGNCTPEEKTAVETLINTQQEWREKHRELLEVHQLLANHLELDEPSMRFRQNVMEAISQHHISPAVKSYIDKRIIYGIGGFFLAMITGLLIYTMAQLNWSGAGTDGGSSLIPFDFNKITSKKIFSGSYTSAFIIINIVLGLMLLDMFLAKKKRGFTKKL